MTTYQTRGGIEIPTDSRIGLSPEAYRGSLGREYVRPSRSHGGSIKVLPELIGRPWDQSALNLIHGLRPSAIRVTEGVRKLNSEKWRVTVIVTPENVIKGITQEVDIAIVDERHESESPVSQGDAPTA